MRITWLLVLLLFASFAFAPPVFAGATRGSTQSVEPTPPPPPPSPPAYDDVVIVGSYGGYWGLNSYNSHFMSSLGMSFAWYKRLPR